MPSQATKTAPAPTITTTTVTIDQITISRFNVRTHAPDIARDQALEASILHRGLDNPIDVHPLAQKGKWGAFAGGRRTRAITALVKDGRLPADWPVKVNLHEGYTDGEIVVLSLDENIQRRDLREHEIAAAVARAIALGQDLAGIAAALGVEDPRTIEQWKRLGRLHPVVFEAFAAGTIDLAKARAFAATEDQELQAAVWEQLKDSFNLSAANIRRALHVGDEVQRRHLNFVGEAIYRAAGGRYELDLFADDAGERGRVVDLGILERLVEERMVGERDKMRVATQDRDLRFVAQPPQAPGGYTDHQLQVDPKWKGERITLPSGDVVAHLSIEPSGETRATFWWADRKAKAAGAGTGKRTAGDLATAPRVPIGNAVADRFQAQPLADARLKEDDGLTAESTLVFRSIRKAIERGALLADALAGGDVARDVLVWAQARMLIADRHDVVTGMRRIADDSYVGYAPGNLDAIRAHLAPLAATRAVAAAIEQLKAEDFMREADPAASFRTFRGSTDGVKRRAAAIVAGLALERSLAADGYRLGGVPDAVVAECHAADDIEVRRHWSPTAELLDAFPKAQRLAIAEDAGVPEPVRRNWPKAKSAELTAALLKALPHDWVHPLLHFDAAAGLHDAPDPDAPAASNGDAELEHTEAAE